MPAIPPLFVQGPSDPASADVEFWAGIALTASPGDDLGDSAFTSIGNQGTHQLAGFRTRRGRQFELDRIEAGVCEAVFTNRDGALDPANTAGPYYPNLKPVRRFRLLRHKAGTTYYLFDGLIERYESEWVIPRNDGAGRTGYQRMKITAVDAFEVLNRLSALVGHDTYTTNPTGNAALLWTAVAYGDSGVTVEYVNDGASQPLSVTVSGQAVTVHLATNGSGTPTSDANAIMAAVNADPEANLLVVVTRPSGDGTTVPSAQGPHTLTGGAWASERSGARIDRTLTAANWAVGARQLDGGLYDVASYGPTASFPALTHIQDVADGEAGYLFIDARGRVVFHDGDHRASSSRSVMSQATYSDDGTGFAYTDIRYSFDYDRIYNDVTVTAAAAGAAAQQVTDASSISSYLTRPLSKSTQLQNDADALTIANALLAAYKAPVARFQSITLTHKGEAGWEDAVWGREIGDRVTVRTSPPGHNTVLTYDCFIEAIEHSDDAYGRPMATFQLTNVDVAASGGGGGGGGGGALHDSSGDNFTLDNVTMGVLG